MTKRALIFGCNGFVGPYLARELEAAGYDVYGSDVASAPKIECANYWTVDILDMPAVSKAIIDSRCDVLINLAAVSSVGQSWRNPRLTMQVNVTGALNILETVRVLDNSCKVLLIGSSEQYAPAERPLIEDDPLDASNPYGISKSTQERLAKLYCDYYDVKVYIARAFNHTGPGQNPSFAIPNWCNQVAKFDRMNKPGVMHVGNLSIKRDISDVRDIVRGYRLLFESDYVGIPFNFGSGNAVDFGSLLSIIKSFSDVPISFEVDKSLVRPNDTPYICCDRSKAEKLLGWRPAIELGETLYSVYRTFLAIEQ